jgi:hypothetical protein
MEERISELRAEIQDLKAKTTYEDIQKANEQIRTTDIKGKEYAEVNQRIKAFRMVHPEGSIQTRLLSNENGVCIFRAEVYSNRYTLLATGTAYEKEGSTFINKTSYIENCETSAVGRALAMLGFEIKKSVASREEVENAKLQQEMMKPIGKEQAMALVNTLKAEGFSDEDIGKSLAKYKVNKAEELTEAQYAEILLKLNKK